MKKYAALAAASAFAAVTASSAVASAQQCDAPRILFVVDNSSSMLQEITEGGTSQPKWMAVRDAVSQVLSTYPVGAQYGLMAFPGANGGCDPGDVLVDVAPNTAQAIDSSLVAPIGGSATPAGQTLMEASFNPDITDPSHANYVIFLSDGWQWCDVGGGGNTTCATSADCTNMGLAMCPSCNSDGDGCYCVRNWPVLGVEALAAQGVTTYVVGFGTEVDALTLNQAAQAGGTALAGCDPNSNMASCYLQATVPSELTQALASIVQNVVTETCVGPCGIMGEMTCGVNGWSDCMAPDTVSCTAQPCGMSGTQQCVGGALSECSATCDDPTAGAAGGDGLGGTGGDVGFGGTGGTGSSVGGGGDGSGDDASGTNVDDEGGCGCRTAGAPDTKGPLGLALAGLVGLLAWRRRRDRA